MVSTALAGTAAGADEAALFQITVNGVDKGTARVVIRGNDVFIALDSLKAAGIAQTPAAAQTIDGVVYIRASDLGPRIRFRYDEANLAVTLDADPRLLAPTTINLAQSAPRNLEYIDSPSGFLNYALSTENGHTPSFVSEQGVRLAGALFDDTFSVDRDGRFVRSTTSLSFDNRARSTRLTLGDSLTEAGAIGGVARIGGVTYATEFSLNPYVTPFPNQRFAGTVSTPSTADIYINGRQVRTIDLPPGTFNLENLPGVAGAGNIRVVVRNALGQSQELGAPYYMGTQLLRAGLHAFSYSAGVERDPAFTGVGSYGPAAFSLHDRYGLSDSVSIGAFAAADEHHGAAGPEITFGTPLGIFGVYGAGSTEHRIAGSSAAAQYTYQSARFSLGAAYTYTSPHYATLGFNGADDRAISRLDAFFAAPIAAIADVNVDLSHARYRDAGLADRASITASTRLGARFNLALTLSHAQFSHLPVDNGVFLALTMALGRATAASASVDVERRGTTEAVQVQRARPYGEGFGYLVQAENGPQASNVADVQYQGRYGLYEVDVSHQPGATNVTASVSGSLVAIGGRLLPTRPIQDAYALIRVPGVEGVTGTLSHQSVGKTDSHGDLLVPNLISSYGNEIGISDQDVPLDYAIAATDRTVAPPYRGGAVIAFPVARLQAFKGTLEVTHNGEAIVPAYGEFSVTIDGKTVESPIGGRGEFYLEGLTGQKGEAEIRYEGGVCTFAFTAPASHARFVEMGKLTCAQQP